jgi:hypothetical protein
VPTDAPQQPLSAGEAVLVAKALCLPTALPAGLVWVDNFWPHAAEDGCLVSGTSLCSNSF